MHNDNSSSNVLMSLSMALSWVYQFSSSHVIGFLTSIVLVLTIINQYHSLVKYRKDNKHGRK
jgi:hypothetical protein